MELKPTVVRVDVFLVGCGLRNTSAVMAALMDSCGFLENGGKEKVKIEKGWLFGTVLQPLGGRNVSPVSRPSLYVGQDS